MGDGFGLCLIGGKNETALFQLTDDVMPHRPNRKVDAKINLRNTFSGRNELEAVKTNILKTAEEVISLLRSMNENLKLRQEKNAKIIYRGMGSDQFDLSPSAFRPDGEAKLVRLFQATGILHKATDLSGSVGHAMREHSAIRSFYSMANAQGLRLPVESALLHAELLSSIIGVDNLDSIGRFYNQQGNWPQPDLFSIIALAQHYGIPTRILDWSHDPLVAAYFAATSALERTRHKEDAPKYFAIWYVNKISLAASALFDRHNEIPTPRYGVRMIDIPFNGNPNLQAQKGTFSVVFRREKQEPSDPVDTTTVNQAMKLIYDDLDGVDQRIVVWPNDNSELFHRILVPVEMSKPLLEKLYVLGYHSASIFPGFKGCADALFEASDILMED